MARHFDRDIKEYEDNVEMIGYYCDTCEMDWVLEKWDGNPVPNDMKRVLQYFHHQEGDCVGRFTRTENEHDVNYACQQCSTHWTLHKYMENEAGENGEGNGYVCSMCKKEWLSDEERMTEIDMRKLRRHTHICNGFGEVEGRRETFIVDRYKCGTCKREWLLRCLDENERRELKDALNCHHHKKGCGREVEYKGEVFVKEYSCTGTCTCCRCEKKWLLKQIPRDNEDFFRRVREMKSLQDHHNEAGCLGAIRFIFSEENEEHELGFAACGTIGYYCTDCRKEWLTDEWNRNSAPSITEKAVDHHYVPTFQYLQISDTGNRVYWKNVRQKLKRGDHVAWQRWCWYWHHAIVEEVRDNEVTVIEWSSCPCRRKVCCYCPILRFNAAIHRTCHRRSGCYGLIKKCFDGPMYNVHYPIAIQMQNPPNLVLSRAYSRLNNRGYSITGDNCEHFATFCKTGSHKSDQLSQIGLTFHAWGLKRLVIALIHVLLLVGFAEMIEEIFGKGKDVVGLAVIGIVEVLYVAYTICAIYCADTPGENFTNKKRRHCSHAFGCASAKIFVHSLCMVLGTIAMTVCLNNNFIGHEPHKGHSWHKGWRTLSEIGTNLAGGLLGALVGNILTFSFPWLFWCCAVWFPKRQSHQIDSNPDLGLQHLLYEVRTSYQSIKS